MKEGSRRAGVSLVLDRGRWMGGPGLLMGWREGLPCWMDAGAIDRLFPFRPMCQRSKLSQGKAPVQGKDAISSGASRTFLPYAFY